MNKKQTKQINSFPNSSSSPQPKEVFYQFHAVIVLIPAPQHHTHLPLPFIFLTSPAGRPDTRIPFTIHQSGVHHNHPQRERALEEEENERSMLKEEFEKSDGVDDGTRD